MEQNYEEKNFHVDSHDCDYDCKHMRAFCLWYGGI